MSGLLARCARGLLALGASSGLLVSAVCAQSVAFINPGKSDEVFWVTVTRTMEAAARDLEMRFEVLYVERQPPRAIALAKEIAARPAAQRPDYVILVNEAGTGLEMLSLLDAVGIKSFLAFSGFATAAERAKAGAPRSNFRHWLGSLEPHAEEAGYLTAQALLRVGRERKWHSEDGKLHLLALSGDRATPTSVRRSEGMRRAVAEAGDAVLDQEVYAAFSRDKAAEQSPWLYQRYPATRLVWAGNDLMAFGAMQALEALGRVAGRDVLFSGINTSTEAMEAIKSGRLAALAGGHFILGAWAMVVVHDHHRGVDFAASEGLEMHHSMFTAFTPRLAEVYLARYGAGRFDAIDFRSSSKARNPKLKRYDFNFARLLE